MPARIPPCLESTKLQPPRIPNPHRSGRRAVHSAFWNHGSVSLNLPYWWDIAPFKPKSTRHSNAASGEETTVESGILDFLYPKKTLALMRRLARDHNRSLRLFTPIDHPRPSPSSSPSTSAFIHQSAYLRSKAAVNGAAVNSTAAVDSLWQHIQDLKWSGVASKSQQYPFYLSSKLRALVRILTKPIPEQNDLRTKVFSEAWRLYGLLEPQEQSVHIKIELANFMSMSGNPDDQIRMAFLVESPDIESHFSAWRTIVGLLYAGRLAEAIQVHEHAVRDTPQSYVGSDILLAHAVRAENWSTALQVSTAVYLNLTSSQSSRSAIQPIQQLWKFAVQLPDISALATKYAAHAYERLDVHHSVLQNFLRHFFLATVSRLPQMDTSIQLLLDSLEKYQLTSGLDDIYEIALERMCLYSGGLTEPVVHLISSLWNGYSKKRRPRGSDQSMVANILRVLTRRSASYAMSATAHQDLIIKIVQASLSSSSAPPRDVLVSLLNMYAKQGNVFMTQSLNSQLTSARASKEGSEGEVLSTLDVERFSALIRVHTTRGESDAAEEVFSSILEQVPSAVKMQVLWIELMRAYAERRDFGKAFDILFKRMPAAGLEPDAQAFETAAVLATRAGDVKAVTSILNFAKQHGRFLGRATFLKLLDAHATSGLTMSEEDLASLLEAAGVPSENTQLLWKARMVLWEKQIAAAARDRDDETVSSLYTQMLHSGVQIPSHVFESVVNLLTRIHRTDEAAHVVNEVLPQHGIRTRAIFRSYLIRGYWHEGLHGRVLIEYDKLIAAGEYPTVMAETYRLNALATISRQYPATDIEISELLQKTLDNQSTSVTFERDFPPVYFKEYYDVYLSGLIEQYSHVRAWDFVNHLKTLYFAKHTGTEVPLGMLKAFMVAHMHAEDLPEVEKLFQLAVSQLSRYHDVTNEAFDRLDDAEAEEPEEEIEFPEVADSYSSDWISNDGTGGKTLQPRVNKWHMMGFLVMPYLECLAKFGEFDRLVFTMEALRSRGTNFTVRRLARYLELLALSGEPKYVITAFRLGEEVMNSRPMKYSIGPIKRHYRKTEEEGVVDEYRRRRSQLWLSTRSILLLKELWIASLFSSIKGSTIDVEELSMTVSFSQVLEQIAPNLTTYLKDLVTDHNRVGKYPRTPPAIILSSKTRRARTKTLESMLASDRIAREKLFGPNTLTPTLATIEARERRLGKGDGQRDRQTLLEAFDVKARPSKTLTLTEVVTLMQTCQPSNARGYTLPPKLQQLADMSLRNVAQGVERGKSMMTAATKTVIPDM